MDNIFDQVYNDTVVEIKIQIEEYRRNGFQDIWIKGYLAKKRDSYIQLNLTVNSYRSDEYLNDVLNLFPCRKAWFKNKPVENFIEYHLIDICIKHQTRYFKKQENEREIEYPLGHLLTNPDHKELITILAKYEAYNDLISSLATIGKEPIEFNPDFLKVNDKVKQQIFDILKIHFEESEHRDLISLLGGTPSRKKLLFMDQGIRLINVFGQLYNENLLSNAPQKKTLIKWLRDNFSYLHKEKSNSFKEDYLNKKLSFQPNGQLPCQKPLIKIENNQIIPQARLRNKSL